MAATFHATGFANASTTVASLTATVTITAGDSVVVFGSWDVNSTTTPTVATVGGTGSDAFTLVYGPFSDGVFKYGAWLLQSAGSGRTGAIISWASSSPTFGDIFADSFSGLVSPVLDQTAFAHIASGTAVGSGNTPTLTSSDEFCIGFMATESSLSNSDGTAGWTFDGTTNLTKSSAQHQVVTTTAPIASNFTQQSSIAMTFALTFKAGAAAPVLVPPSQPTQRITRRPWLLAHVAPQVAPVVGATPPTFVSVTTTPFNTSTSPKTTATIAVQNGDVLLGTVVCGDGSGTAPTISTASGSTSAWTQVAEPITFASATFQSYLSVWSAVATATGNITVSFTKTSGSFFGGWVRVWRGSDGVGNAGVANNGSGGSSPPSVSVTTSRDHSAVNFDDADWNATGGTVTFTSTAGGTPVLDTQDFSSGTTYTSFGSHVVDAGTADSVTMGMTSPVSQNFVSAAVEVKGHSAAVSYTMTADPASFVMAGTVTGLRAARTTAAVTGAFTLNGVAVGLRHSYPLVATVGTYTLNGAVTGLRVGRATVATTGTFTLSGAAATLRMGHVVPAVAGAFALSGVTAGLRVGRGTTAVVGTFVLGGVTTILRYARIFSQTAGSFVLNGIVANLISSGSGSKVLPASPGAFVLAGNAVNLPRTYVVKLVVGAFTLNGVVATLDVGRRLGAVAGTFTLGGNAVTLRYGHVALASAGAITLGGNAAQLVVGKVLTAIKGTFTLIGQPAALRSVRTVPAVAGTVVLNGIAANLVYTPVSAAKGVKVWTGTAWVSKPAKVWTGSAWVVKPVKTWNGSVWH